MGAAASRGNSGQAYHVLQVTPNSPGEKAGLTSFFDFITAANGQVLDKDDSAFVDILNSNVNQPVKLQVFNALQNGTRETVLTPNREWGGAGLAGINVRMSEVTKALTLVWHVVLVHPNGPASAAGLQSGTDFIVGVPGLLFSEADDFYNLVKVNLNKALSLYVYSTVTRSIRVASVTPDHNWGGNGFLGCDVAYGLNHQLVAALSSLPEVLPQQAETERISPLLESPVPQKPKVAIPQSPPTPLLTPSPKALTDNAPQQMRSQASPHQHDHSVKKHKHSSGHKHSGACNHSHDHKHGSHDHSHDSHSHNDAHSHECDSHSHNGAHSSNGHVHDHPPANQAPSTPNAHSTKQHSSESASVVQLPSTPKAPSEGAYSNFTYIPSQLFSPFQKLSDNYNATPLPDDLMEVEEAIPFQTRFGR